MLKTAVVPNIFVETMIWFLGLCFCNINVFTVTFDSLNASFLKKKYLQSLFERYCNRSIKRF